MKTDLAFAIAHMLAACVLAFAGICATSNAAERFDKWRDYRNEWVNPPMPYHSVGPKTLRFEFPPGTPDDLCFKIYGQAAVGGQDIYLPTGSKLYVRRKDL